MLLSLLLAAAAPATSAEPRPAASATTTSIRADSLALARILNPEGPMIEMVVRTFREGMRSVVGSNEDYLALEKDHPGISEAVIKAMTEAMRADVVADMPAMRDRYARFYADRFSPAETAELIRFFSSQAGQRLIAAKFAKLDAKPLTNDLVVNPDAQVSEGHIRAMNRSAANSIVGEMSEEDLAALRDFAKNPVFLKMTQARSAIEQLEAQIANEPDAELDKALEAAVQGVIARYTGDVDPPE